MKMKHFVADFETITNQEETRIWAYGLTEIGNIEFFRSGRTMDHFFNFLEQQTRSIVYFHNLKFDGEFLIHYLLSNGYKHSDEKDDKTFNVIISKLNQFYSIEVIFKKQKGGYKKVSFRDSYKKLPFKVKDIAKNFDLPIQKGEIDYHKDRPIGYIPNREEISYIRNDVEIVARALEMQYQQGMKRMTTSADALHDFKESIGGRDIFFNLFPSFGVEVHNAIKEAYKGGYTYVNKIFQDVDIDEGCVYDVNSLYPSVMYDKLLPFDYPLYFKGEYKKDIFYPLYIQTFVCSFRVKENHIPTVQLKDGYLMFNPTEYITDTEYEPVELTLTNIDMELFFDHYDVHMYEYVDGWMFRGAKGIFKPYIDKWMKVKEDNTPDPDNPNKKTNPSLRILSKLMMNSLYGKFGKNPDVTGKYPVLRDGIVEYDMKEPEFSEPIYIPLAIFVTSWARNITIRSAQKVYDRFLYADTDSLHLKGVEEPDIDIHQTKLGAWKHEGNFEKARFIRAKSYIEIFNGELHVTVSGMPDNLHSLVTWENFHTINHDMLLPCRDGYYYGKLIPKRIKGGVVLTPTEFTIR